MLAGELIDRTKHIRLAHRSIFIPNTAPSNQRNSLLRAKTEGAIHFHFPPTSNSYGTTTTLQLKDKKKRNNCAIIFLHACANEISCSSCQLAKFPKAVFRTVITTFVASSITGMLPLHAETLILACLARTNICSVKSNDNSQCYLRMLYKRTLLWLYVLLSISYLPVQQNTI